MDGLLELALVDAVGEDGDGGVLFAFAVGLGFGAGGIVGIGGRRDLLTDGLGRTVSVAPARAHAAALREDRGASLELGPAEFAVVFDPSALQGDAEAPEHLVDGLPDVERDEDVVAALDLDEDVEGWRGLAFEDGLLGASPAGLDVAERDSLNAADEVGEGGVLDEVFEGVAVRGGDELDSPFGDGAGGVGLKLGADLVDDDDLGHVVFDGLDHDGVLLVGGRNLHPARAADAGVGDVAVAGYLVGGVHDDDTLAGVVCEDAGDVAEHGRLADAGLAEQEDALARADDVLDDADGAVDGAAYANGESDDLAGAVPDGRDAMEGAFDAGPVVGPERADVLGDVFEVGMVDLPVAEDNGVIGEAGLRRASEVEDDFEKLVAVLSIYESFGDPGREFFDDLFEVGFNPLLHGGW